MQEELYQNLVDYMNQKSNRKITLEQVKTLGEMLTSDIEIPPVKNEFTKKEVWYDPIKYSEYSLEAMNLLGIALTLNELEGLPYLTWDRDYTNYMNLCKEKLFPKWFSKLGIQINTREDKTMDILNTDLDSFKKVFDLLKQEGFSELTSLLLIENCCNYDDFTYAVEALGYTSIVDFLNKNEFIDDSAKPNHDLFIQKANPLFMKEFLAYYEKEKLYES